MQKRNSEMKASYFHKYILARERYSQAATYR